MRRLTMEEIKAGIQNIKEILVRDENFYQIPDYQRPYSWDRDNVSALIDDLVTAHADNKDENYFCGSLVFVKNSEDSRFDVIDGQQRLTTFTIIACVFRDIYLSDLGQKSKDYINASIQDKYENDKRRLRFLTDERYQVDFENTVLQGIKFDDAEKNEGRDNKYLENAHHIKDFLKEKIEERKISMDEFVQWFFEKVVLTVIACPNQDSAIRIFNVLNDRGMPLSSIDILKSSLMQKLSNKEDRTAFKAKWGEIDSKLESANANLDGMLTAYLYYKKSANPEKRMDKELIEIFSKEGKKHLDVLHELDNFSKAYIETLEEQDKHLYCLQYLQHKIYWTSILSTAKFTKYPKTDKLKSLLVAYYYQNWIAGATVARIKQTSFNILGFVKSKAAINTIRSEMRNNLDIYATTKTFKEEIGSWVYGRKWDKAILLLIEYFSSDDSKRDYINIDKKLHLEHVLPQTPTSDWEKIFSQDEMNHWTNSLANLTLLSMKKNIQATNASFEDKKNTYKNKNNVASSFTITRDITDCETWDVATLEKRKTRLIGKVMEKLDLFQ